MKSIKGLIKPGFSYIFGLLSFILYSASFLIGYDDESENHMLIIAKAGLILISALFFLIPVFPDQSKKMKSQYSFFSALILLYQILSLCAVGKLILSLRYYSAIFSSLVWIAASLFILIRYRETFSESVKGLFTDRDTNILILSSALLSLSVIILSAEPNGVRFTWDSDTLYGFINNLDYKALYDAKLLTFHSHVSVFYALIIVLFRLLFNSIHASFFIVNAMCIIAASFGMTFLLRKLAPGKNSISYILGSALFVLSPWVCGMSTYHIYDYYIWCLFPLLMYFCCKRNVTGFFVVGCMITFSKASGLIVFGSACLGLVITDTASKLSRKSLSSVKSLFLSLIYDIRYWLYASVALVFFIFFKLGIPSDTQFEDTVFGLRPYHFIHILKIYMTADFLWIFVILTVILLINIFFTKKTVLTEDSKRTLSILLISDLFFVLFNCLCITFRLPRYMDSHISVLYICGALCLLCINDSRIYYSLTGIICALTFVSSFRMIDPVTQGLFNKIDVGGRQIICYEMTDQPGLGDSIICNREYYSYETLLNKALTYVINDKDSGSEILFSLGEQDTTWGFSGGRYSYSFHENRHYFDEFYDRKTNGLANGYSYEYTNSDDMIPFEMHYIFPQETVSDALSVSGSDTFYYIYMPSMNNGKEQEISEAYRIEDELKFDFRGWKMNVIKFRKS